MAKTQVKSSDIAAATITDTSVAAANKDGVKTLASMRTLSAAVAAAIGTAAAGTAQTASSSDHVHPTGAGTPSTQAFGDAAATGSGPAAAMTDHKHAMPADPVTAHASAADPHTGYQKESEKGAASGYASLDSGILVPIGQLPTGTTGTTVALGNHAHANDHARQHSVTAAADHTFPGGTSTFLRADGSFATPSAAASNPWDGVVVGAREDGNPRDLLRMASAGTVAATPTAIGTAVARIAYFRLPAGITVNKIRFYGVGATTNVYRCAIYNADTLARLTAELPFTTAAATWGAAGTSLNLALTAGQLYFIAVSVNATGTTAGCLCITPTFTTTTGTMGTLPKSWAGSMDVDAGYVAGAFAQFAVTSGALPATAATIAVPAAWTGGFPAFWLDSNNA